MIVSRDSTPLKARVKIPSALRPKIICKLTPGDPYRPDSIWPTEPETAVDTHRLLKSYIDDDIHAPAVPAISVQANDHCFLRTIAFRTPRGPKIWKRNVICRALAAPAFLYQHPVNPGRTRVSKACLAGQDGHFFSGNVRYSTPPMAQL